MYITPFPLFVEGLQVEPSKWLNLRFWVEGQSAVQALRVSGWGLPAEGEPGSQFNDWSLGLMFGFQVSGFGFWVSGFGFRVWGLGFRVLGLGCTPPHTLGLSPSWPPRWA